jgi:predicted outer membrane lipoprotein
VASIILIRLSLTEPNPYGELLTLLAMAFGIVTVLVFNFHMRLQSASGKES